MAHSLRNGTKWNAWVETRTWHMKYASLSLRRGVYTGWSAQLSQEQNLDLKWYSTLVVQSFCHVWLFANPWTAAHQASLSFTISWSVLKLMSVELMRPSNHLMLCTPLSSCPQPFQHQSFPMSQCFASGGQSIGASASVFPINTQGWFSLELTGWISLQSKGLWRVFSSTTVWKHQFLSVQPSL